MGRIGTTELLVLFVIVIPFYFLPTIIALARKKNNRTAIFVLNFFLGWTFLGWIVSLVWALTSNRTESVIIHNTYTSPENKSEDTFKKLQKLKALLDSGVLTQVEFDEQKGKILQP